MSKRVIVTGAAGGIGAAASGELRRRGARVVGLDLKAEDGELIACDVRDQRSVDRAVAEAIERLGGVDVLINNAGVGPAQSAGQPPDDVALACIDINMVGAWRVTSAALPALLEARGRVVNVASGLAHLAVPFATAYSMSKRGLVAYSDALRLEHGDVLTVTTVYPGYIKTPIHAESQAEGFALDGIVPEERLEDAAKALTRAALDRPTRDLATTRRGGAGYTGLRAVPGWLKDRGTLSVLKRHARQGRFDNSRMAREFVTRLRDG